MRREVINKRRESSMEYGTSKVATDRRNTETEQQRDRQRGSQTAQAAQTDKQG